MTLEQSLNGCIDRIENRIRELEITAAKQQAVIEMALADAKIIAEKSTKNAQNIQYIALTLLMGNMAVLGTILAAVLHAF